ncbi:MAG: hypothetical protein MPJ50_12365 [Pirellulales bacterium]|nr:hypothetical protein [Pirellulales bacterium]
MSEESFDASPIPGLTEWVKAGPVPGEPESDALFRDNVGLVFFFAKRWCNALREMRAVTKEDIHSAVYAATIKACQSFDPSKGEVSTYVGTCVNRAMSDFINEYGLFPMPSGARGKVAHWQRFLDEHGRLPDLEDECNYSGDDEALQKLAKQLRGGRAVMSQRSYETTLDALWLSNCQVGGIGETAVSMTEDLRVEAFSRHTYDCNSPDAEKYREDRVCVWCGETYRMERDNGATTQYCSKECREAHLAVPARKCRGCSKRFRPTPDKPRASYCSEECKKQTESKKRKESYEKTRKRKPVKKICAECGTEFETNHPRKTFCSVACRDKNQLRRLQKESAEKRKATIKTCPQCEERFTPEKSLAQKYCSEECTRLATNEAKREKRRRPIVQVGVCSSPLQSTSLQTATICTTVSTAV